MLTATYSLVALSAEQKNARNMLSRLHGQIQDILHDLQYINQACVENALCRLEQFEEYCHKRKVEAYVIPAIRKSTRKADPILAELESLSSRSMRILRSLHEQLRSAFERGMGDVRKVCADMDLYCTNLRERFLKEEEELLPIVRALLPIEDWFTLAAKFLSEDEKHRHPAPTPGVSRSRASQTGRTAA
ncbi:hypothetical protein [Janthinobacterium sp. 17J80-10]|uniref:hypothetical protein n=1 Tax=Janthinobacterium sp. 17J80-10 TaxID=2497863 RepID=UPI00100559BB|nr:hypothetical protein [Janthinobacterium sp. 17J80-10]QAU34107.1 hypothetical protein EKL02_07845 [Janthinobacterium sp. 17J80-10]